jgi:hypothetical protein
VLDPSDVAARRFKLFVHSYVAVPGTDPVELHYDWGHIALYSAERPEGPWSAPEKLLGWTSARPAISSDGASQNLSTIPDLAKCVAFTEPGAVATETTVELALGCVELASPTATIRVVLLRSIDHAKTFTLVSTLLRPTEAACASSVPQLNAAHLFGANGRVYVAASTAGPVAGGFTGYNGCVTFEIDDLVKGTLKPGILRSITAAGNRFSGACSYAEETGWVLSTLMLESAPRTFRMFRGGTAP